MRQSKNLLILAGYSASGKTTLLKRSLETGIPLFGADVDQSFQQTRVPPRFPEQSITFEDTLISGTWFSGFHLRALQRQENLPSTIVVHIDITELLWNQQRIPYLSSESSALFPRNLSSLLRLEDNEKILRDYFSAPIFDRFERLVVNTIIVPWDVLLSQYAIRKESNLETSKFRDKFFVQNGPGKRLMSVANIAWLNAVRQTKAKCLVTFSDGKNIKIKSLSANPEGVPLNELPPS